MNTFNAKKVTKDLIEWIREWFEINGKDCKAIIGISGGKDSSVVAALCVEALGVDRVVGVLMPCGIQNDINMAYRLVNFLGIPHCNINIQEPIKNIMNSLYQTIPTFTTTKTKGSFIATVAENVTEQTKINLPARIRMSTLYAVSQSLNGRVANTCNLSENYIGYATKYGDEAGDFSPLANLTVAEVKAIGRELGLPEELIEKVPSDGLCGKTDEDNLGFTYEILDKYIREGTIDDVDAQIKIEILHSKNLFKRKPMESFPFQIDFE